MQTETSKKNSTDNKRFDAILIALLFLIIYAAFPTRMHFGDGLYYAFHLEKMPLNQAFHPHHLLWLPIMHCLYSIFHLVIPSLHAMSFLQAFNALCGGVSVFLMITLVSSITKNRLGGIIAGLALGLSWGMLHYSADANIYVPVLALMLGNFVLITSGNELSYKKAILATIIMTLISFLHQIGFFFSFTILAAILIRSPKNKRVKIALSCVALYAVINLCAYYVIFLSIRSTLLEPLQKNLFTWLTAYGHNEYFWSPFALGFLGAQKAFDRSQFNLFFHIIDQNKAFYYGGYWETTTVLISYAIVQLIVLLTVLFEIYRIATKKATRLREIRIILLIWFIPFYVFNQFFCAFDVGYKLLYQAPLIMIWAVQFLDSPLRISLTLKTAILVLLLGMAIWNFSDGVIPDTKSENNPYFKLAMMVMPYVGEGDLILFTEKERYTAAVMRCYSEADSVFIRENYQLIPSQLEDFSKIENQSIDFLLSRYKRIIVSDVVLNLPYDKWCLPENHIPPPHPDILIFNKSSLFDRNIRIKTITEIIRRY